MAAWGQSLCRGKGAGGSLAQGGLAALDRPAQGSAGLESRASLRRSAPQARMTRKLFVTTALPYANAPFHVGHMMEYIQADIWVRFQRMQGNEVHFVCADDAHGAPIMIAAEKAGKTPQQFVAEIAAGRKPYLDGFHIGFDNWHSHRRAREPRAGAGHLPRAAQATG